jgi:hypothetical protein
MHAEDAVSAERLNELWDRLVDEPSAGARSGEANALDPQLVTLIHYLESLKPGTQNPQLTSLRNRVDPFVPEGIATMTNVSSHSGPVTVDSQRSVTLDRSHMIPVGKAMNRFAAVALMLFVLVVSALVILASMRGVIDIDPPQQLAAIIGLDTNKPDIQFPESRGGMSITVRPGDYEGGRVEIGLWQVTLPSGFAVTSTSSTVPIGITVMKGSVLLDDPGGEMPVGEGSSIGDLPENAYIRNPDEDSVELLLLMPLPLDGTFPLTLEPSSPDRTDDLSVSADEQGAGEPVLLSLVKMDDSEAFQYRVSVDDILLGPGMSLEGVTMVAPPGSVLRAVTVLEGRLAVAPGTSDSTREPARDVSPGETLYPDETGAWNTAVQVGGPDNARVLGLSTMPAADNHTLDQTLPSIAPFWGEWTVPAFGEIDLTIRRVVMESNGSYSLPSNAGVIYHVASGTVSVHDKNTGSTMQVAAGGTVAQLPGTVLSFTNLDSVPVELYQSIVSDASQGFTSSEELRIRVAIETVVETTETLPSGDVSVMMEVFDFNGTNDGGLSGDGPSLVLVTSMDGDISVRRDGGDAELVTGIGEPPVKPDLGEGNQIGPGGYLVAQPDAGWGVTGGTGAPATGLVLSISPTTGPWTRPLATPMSTPITTDQMIGQAGACDMEPLTVEQVNNLAATPSATTSPLERSLRHDQSGVSDPATTDDITALLQAYTDCNASGDYPTIYAFYSDQAIRESEVIQDLVESEHNVGEDPYFTTTVEDIELFEDGRAGARTVIGHQAAYLTFVFEDGRWKIDVWDDSEP